MKSDPKRAVRALAQYFWRNGYVRVPDTERLSEEGAQQYKKGYEVRLVANSAEELRLMRRLLREAGFRPGRPFRKAQQYRQPLYGREVVVRFLESVKGVGGP